MFAGGYIRKCQCYRLACSTIAEIANDGTTRASRTRPYSMASEPHILTPSLARRRKGLERTHAAWSRFHPQYTPHAEAEECRSLPSAPLFGIFDLFPHPQAVTSFIQHSFKLSYESRVNEINKLVHPELVNPYLDTIDANIHYDHVQHCFENVRQALVCHADSNLEDLEKDGATTGWGFKRMCRDFDGLFEWSEKWRTSDEDDLLDS